ncbi:hypothetical protein ZWY2020_057033 [Hordeum vulgare]|nr:hypothetical protein ZWY2020_057033 [Hordeum vulgare]
MSSSVTATRLIRPSKDTTNADGALEHSSISIDDATNDEDDLTNLMASGSDQDSGPSSPNHSVDRSPPSHIKPCGASLSPMAPSFTTTVGDIDLHSLGERMAMEMDQQAIRSEVVRQFRAHRHQEQRLHRRVHRRAAAPMKFSLRLSNEEAMDDVVEISVPKDVKPEPGAPARDRNRKQRRGG